jgi:hypothetical protein
MEKNTLLTSSQGLHVEAAPSPEPSSVGMQVSGQQGSSGEVLYSYGSSGRGFGKLWPFEMEDKK